MDRLSNYLPAAGDSSEQAMEKIRVILCALFAAFLPFDMFYSTFMIFVIAGASLIDISLKKIRQIPPAFPLFAFAILLSLSGIWYSTDGWRAHYLTERQLAFAIFPILLPLAIGKPTAEKVNLIFAVFAGSCVFAISFLLINALDLIYSAQLPLRYLFTYSFFNHNFSAPIGTHATYLSLYASMSMLFLVDKLARSTRKRYRLLYLASVMILTVGLLFLQSRNGILSLVFTLLFVFPLFSVANRKKYYLITVLSLALFAAILSRSDYIRERFTTELSTDLKTGKQVFTARNPEPRSWRWACAWKIIREKPLFGHGTGDEIPLLLVEYKKHNYQVSFREQFNSHNQYLSVMIKHGVAGLIVFLAALAYFFRLAVSRKNFLYVAFLTLTCLGFITEDIIDANKGIFFFAFFNTLLGYHILYIRKTPAETSTTP
ncbi:O-antigen ligase family protein [Rurimicrobium arvi]|uniref:O-antigen ligase-related domain-containing protein n=1 Tax=Rurimicrobium arvi TaxID=2049916 RepID=A0ABP8MFD0_9BACT